MDERSVGRLPAAKSDGIRKSYSSRWLSKVRLQPFSPLALGSGGGGSPTCNCSDGDAGSNTYTIVSSVVMGGIVSITDTPTMPALNIRLSSSSGVSGTVNWAMCVCYKRYNRHEEYHAFATLPVSVPWVFATMTDWGNNFRGGKVVITTDRTSDKFVFYIRGTNPTEAAAISYINSVNTRFYALAMAKLESGTQAGRTYLQFNEIGLLGPTPDSGGSWDTNIRACPNRSSDQIGWGMYQLTNPVPSDDQVWNWKSNVLAARARMDDCTAEATTWINNQKAQATSPLSAEVFTWNGVNFQEATSRTPIDACAIQRYNGVQGGWVIWWDNATSTWKHKSNAYLEGICARL
jgi:hypothetical protein